MPLTTLTFRRLLFTLLTPFLVLLHLSTIPTSAAQPPNRLKISAILPLTGPLADFGVAAKNGFEQARREHPELFNKIDFVFDDAQYDNAKSITSFQRLRIEHNMLLSYVWGYGPNQAVAPVAEAQKFPLIAVSAERSISAHRTYTLRFGYHIEMIADALLEFVRSKGFKRIVLVKTELAYMNGLIDFMRKKMRADESIEIADVFQISDTDFKTSISKLRSRQFDVLGVFLVGPQVSQFYKEMKQLNFTSPTIGTDFFDSKKVLRDAEGTMFNAAFAAPLVSDEFAARYTKLFGDDDQVAWAANAYEFAILAGKAFGTLSVAPSSIEVIERLKGVRDSLGGAAQYTFNESLEGSGFDFAVGIKTIE